MSKGTVVEMPSILNQEVLPNGVVLGDATRKDLEKAREIHEKAAEISSRAIEKLDSFKGKKLMDTEYVLLIGQGRDELRKLGATEEFVERTLPLPAH